MKKNYFPFIVFFIQSVFIIFLNCILFVKYKMATTDTFSFNNGLITHNGNAVHLISTEFFGFSLFISSLLSLFLLLFTKNNFKNYLASIDFRHLKSKESLIFALFIFAATFLELKFPYFFESSYTISKDIMNVFLLVLTSVFIIPFIEEYIFRYYLINHIFDNKNNTFKIIVSSILFTLLHLYNLTIGGIVLVFIFSILSTLFYLRIKNVTLSLFYHFLHNLITVIVIISHF